MRRKPFVGVWLDHREAFLVWADEEQVLDTQRVASDYQETAEPVDRAPCAGAGSSSAVVPHASLDRRRKEQLGHYYKRLVKPLRSAEQILIFGPGMARKELAHALAEHKDLGGRVRGVESADHMTARQMAAQVRRFFGLPSSTQ